MPRLLFIVARNQPDLYAYLCRRFASDPEMKMVLDRRQGERRRDSVPPSIAERRQRDRRQNAEVALQLLTMGYAFARPAEAVASSATG
jgi:hypothetical protein